MGVGRKNFRGGGGQRKKDRKIAKKRPKNSTIKPLSTKSVPYVKLQGGHDSPVPRCRRPWVRVPLFTKLHD